MTIQWGAWEYSGGNGMRAGIQIESVTTPVNGSTTFVVTFSLWTQNQYQYEDNQTFDLTTSGGVSAALSDSSIAYFNGEAGGTAYKRGSNQTATYTYSTYGSSPGSIHINGTVNGTYNGVTPNITVTQTVPARPYAVPAAPTNPTATRISDTQIDLAWTNNSTASALYQNVKIYRATDGGSYALIATLGLVAAYSDISASANHKYTYKIQASNSAGTADSVATTAVYTTPGTPTIGTATKLGNGNISLTWTNNVGYGDTAYTTRIEESQNGGAFSELASVSGGVTSYEHVAPSTSVTHTYRVRHRSTTGSLNGAYSANSNTVTLLSTANAPTGLSPSGVARDATDAITLSWTHNPTDGTPQSKRRVQVKINAGAYSDLVNDTSSTSSYVVTGGTWTNGDTITWKVSTAGENGTLSADSAESTITLSAKPTVNISVPTATYVTSLLTVQWAYFQAQSSAQASWQAKLYDAGAVLLETISGTTQTQGTFVTTVVDGATYTVKVTVTSAAGLTSLEDSQAFTVDYLLPAAIMIAGAFDNTAGFTVLTLTGAAAGSGYTKMALDGTGDYASTPDAAALDITGDIDIRIDLEMADWTPAANNVLVAKWASASDQRSYEVTVTTSGFIRLRISTDGTLAAVVEATSSVAPTPVNNRLSLRIDRNSGVVTFYTSTNGDLTTATWTQLGTTQACAGTIFASTATLRVGADDAGNTALTGAVYSMELRNSSDTVVANPNFSAQPPETASFADAAGLTWTLAGNAAIVVVVPATVAITTVDVQRQINSGAWLTIFTGVVLNPSTFIAVVQDTVPITVGTNNYRAIAYSALPSSLMSAEDEVITSETTWGYLSGGVDFGTVARFSAMPAYAASTGRAKALYHFAGRPKPVQLAGEALTTTLSVSGKLSSGSGSAADFEALGLAEGVVCWRGPDGRRMFASIGKMDLGATRLHVPPSVAFTLTEIDFVEGDQ